MLIYHIIFNNSHKNEQIDYPDRSIMQANNINQVLIGALNRTNNSYSIGNIDGLNFIACAISKDLFILDENFKQIQTIPSGFDQQITAISVCNESGKIAICDRKNVQIYEPISQNNGQQSPYNWISTQNMNLNYQIDYIHWILDGYRLLIFAEKYIQLYQHKLISCAIDVNRPSAKNGEVKFSLNPAEDECTWEIIWQTKLANKIKHVRVSHDGTLFATSNEKEPLIKIWYQLKDSQSFSFIYIQHPAQICGFEWRHSGGHLMPRRLVHNALITWCEDNTARIWKEIPSNEPTPELHFINAVQNAIAIHHDKENFNKPSKKSSHNSHRVAFQMRKAKNRLVHKLTHIMNEKKKVSIVDNTIPGTTNEMIRSSTFADFSIPAYTPSDTLVFCLAATINAENDCFLVPSMSSSQIDGNPKIKMPRRVQTKPFTVHWLNNKEYEFEIGTQRILAESIFERSDSRDISPCQMMHSLHSSTSSTGLATEVLNVPSTHLPHPTTSPNLYTKAGHHQNAEQHQHKNPLAKDLIDYKLEKLLRHWSKSCDILFTIHPIDGSLLTWTLEWLDDPWKQPIISFSSRIPEAFPLVDTISLLPHLNTMRPSFHNLYEQWQQIQTNPIIDNAESVQRHELQNCITCDKFMTENNEIYLLTEHQNGCLNLWRLQMDSAFNANELVSNQPANISSTMSVVNCIHGIRLCKSTNEPTAIEILRNEGFFDPTCLSISNQKQREQSKNSGISPTYVISAFHSDNETELLNTIPCVQKQQENWDGLRAYGIGWWLRNNTTLRNCIERVAKNAFQKDQTPMDAALFYLAMRKKNVLTQLFRTVNDSRMYEFFREDFTLERWKKAALKNAFILMSKHRFHHAAAFFLLGGSLKDALQTILYRIHDLQLAIVVLRLYETDSEKQFELLTELLCKDVLGCDPEYIQKMAMEEKSVNLVFSNSKRDPFERSMALWIINEYVLSAETLLHEIDSAGEMKESSFEKLHHQAPSLPDIFNIYTFLRRHPLVLRQKLVRAGIATTTTEQFLSLTRQICSKVTDDEKQLYLRTANAHLNVGCPYLALNVLCSLPEQFDLQQEEQQQPIKLIPAEAVKSSEEEEEIDWSTPVNRVIEEKLELNWDDDDDESEVEQIPLDLHNKPKTMPLTIPAKCPPEFQELKLLSILSIMADELNTLASEDLEVAGGQLRLKLYSWLEKKSEMLCRVCYPEEEEQKENEPSLGEEDFVITTSTTNDDAHSSASTSSNREQELPLLHEALQQDRLELRERVRQIVRRRNWLKKHQKMLYTLAAYCALNGHRNIRLIAIQMELLLLLLEVQRNEKDEIQHLNETIPDIHSFPLLVSSLSPNVNLPISPLRFITDQCANLFTMVNEFENIPQQIDTEKVIELFNLCQGLSFSVYQSLSNLENLAASTSAQFTSPLTKPCRHSSTANSSLLEPLQVNSQPNHWPGVRNLIALLTRERFLDEAPPNLRLLLVEFFFAIYIAIFYYALALYDSRLLYRLSAHPVDAKMFGEIFGGGGERRLRSAVPVRPPPPKIDATKSTDLKMNEDELAAMRAKLHAKVFTTSSKFAHQKGGQPSSHGSSEQIIQTWVSPKKHIVQYFMDKVSIEHQATITSDYDSDEDSISENVDQSNEDAPDYFKFQDADYMEEDKKSHQIFQHESQEGYAWTLIRLAIIRQIYLKLEYFIEIAGFDFREVARNFPKLEQIIRRLNFWSIQLGDKLEAEPDGCPPAFLPNMHIQDPLEFDKFTSLAKMPLLQKYGVLIEHGNTPFEYDEPGVKPVRRLWTQLVHQVELMPIFVRFIFGKNQLKNKSKMGLITEGCGDGTTSSTCNILSIIKLIHREHDPIVSFAVDSAHPNQIVISTGRELQELNIGKALDEKDRFCARAPHFPSTSSFLFGQNRAELDIHLQGVPRDPLRDNDDYQLILPGVDVSSSSGRNIPAQTTSNLRKRPISGIRRLESHQNLPYYVSGSSDGSIFLWEWGVEQPIFIARIASQFAKVVKLAFAQNGSRFAAVDGDGLLCLWHAQTGMPSRKPYFSQKCHNKFASDVKYIGQTTTLLVTAGHSTGDQNILLWDTIMPASKAIVHSYVGHPDGGQCLAYQPNSQSIISGGKHGEICIWDVRQRQLRHTFKAFDSTGSSVKCLCLDTNADILAAGSNEGDIKIWSASTAVPQLLYSLPTEHISRSGFSLRQVASISLQGVQQISIDHRMHMFSCGADNSLKIRTIPSLL